MALKAMIVPVTPLAQNCTLLWCDETLEAAVIDPGGDLPTIDAALAQAGATAELAAREGLPIIGPHPDDQFLIDTLTEQGARYGLKAEPFEPTRWLQDGDEVSLGKETLLVRHCPGHTPGHVVFVAPEAHFAVVGDVLFQGSVGRTDFPRGDHDALIKSIRERLFPLGDEITFVPGHGPVSTFGQERRSNPFVADMLFA
jgi:glyoxylase-like metal-dependent hydrolase (beta-lactamase superfamily II)